MNRESEFEPLPDWPRTVFLRDPVQYDLLPPEQLTEVDGEEVVCFMSTPTSLTPAQVRTAIDHVETTHGVVAVTPDEPHADRPSDAPFRIFPLLMRRPSGSS